jgi:hypothetical protein
LWGFNLIGFGFDIHKFESIHDPGAQAMLQRMNLIGEAAKKLDLDVGLGIAVNDAYANSPEAMRADWTAGHDGYAHELAAHYHLELCPNKPGAKELLLKWRKETSQAFKDLGLDYVIPWPWLNRSQKFPAVSSRAAGSFYRLGSLTPSRRASMRGKKRCSAKSVSSGLITFWWTSSPG